MELSGFSSWGSVRKIRSIAEIRLLVTMTAGSATGTTLTQFRDALRSLRLGREQRKLRVSKQYTSELLTQSRSMALDSLVHDMISFAKTSGLYRKEGSRYFPSDLAIELYRTFETNDHIERSVLRFLFYSPYKPYYEFVRAMAINSGELRLDPPLSGRQDSLGLKAYLHSKGFLTDIASFFTIRDLYYDIGILNWYRGRSTKEEVMYLTNQLLNHEALFPSNDRRLLDSLELTGSSNDRFWSAVLRTYSEDGSIGHYANILELRDKVCHALRISDQDFLGLLINAERTALESKYRIVLASTPLISGLPMGYVVKLGTLPKLESGSPVTRMRIDYGVN